MKKLKALILILAIVLVAFFLYRSCYLEQPLEVPVDQPNVELEEKY